MGAFSGKVKDHADIGERLFDQAGFGPRMPGQSKVQIVKAAGAGQESFSGAALLSRTAKVDHGSLRMGLQEPVANEAGRFHGAGSKKVVSAAMSCRTGKVCLFFGRICDLVHAGQRVIFP